MDPLHQRCLRRKRVYILQNLRPEEILDYLIQEEVITIDEKDEIRLRGSRRSQVEALLDKLPRCDPTAFEVFLKCLTLTLQDFIAKELKQELEQLTKKEQSSAPRGPTSRWRKLMLAQDHSLSPPTLASDLPPPLPPRRRRPSKPADYCNLPNRREEEYAGYCTISDEWFDSQKTEELTDESCCSLPPVPPPPRRKTSGKNAENTHRKEDLKVMSVDEMKRLMVCAKEDLVEEARILVQSCDAHKVGKVEHDGSSLLFIATEHGSLKMMKFLLEECDADIEQCGHYEVDGGKRWAPPLYMASWMNRLNAVKFLEEKGARIDSANKYGTTCVMAACMKSDTELVKHLVELGADIDKTDRAGWTCLMHSTQCLELVKYLVEKGANVNAQNREGWTTVMKACKENEIETVKYLVKHGADISQANNSGKTCLMYSTNCLELVKYLVENNASINVRSVDGLTALHTAITYSSPDQADVIELLVQKGADCKIRNKDGDDAIRLACLSGLPDTVSYLVRAVKVDVERDAEAQELLGCYFIDETNDFDKALGFWERAHAKRLQNGLPTPKMVNQSTLFKGVREIAYLWDLKGVKQDPDRMYRQSLLIREHILGSLHPDTSYYVLLRVAQYYDQGNYKQPVHFLTHSLELQHKRHKNMKAPFDRKCVQAILISVEILWRMKSENVRENLTFSSLIPFLRLACSELQVVKNDAVVNYLTGVCKEIEAHKKVTTPQQERQLP